jgi:hypothetical protein
MLKTPTASLSGKKVAMAIATAPTITNPNPRGFPTLFIADYGNPGGGGAVAADAINLRDVIRAWPSVKLPTPTMRWSGFGSYTCQSGQ